MLPGPTAPRSLAGLLADLLEFNAAVVTDSRWEYDVDKLLQAISETVERGRQPPKPHPTGEPNLPGDPSHTQPAPRPRDQAAPGAPPAGGPGTSTMRDVATPPSAANPPDETGEHSTTPTPAVAARPTDSVQPSKPVKRANTNAASMPNDRSPRTRTSPLTRLQHRRREAKGLFLPGESPPRRGTRNPQPETGGQRASRSVDAESSLPQQRSSGSSRSSSPTSCRCGRWKRRSWAAFR